MNDVTTRLLGGWSLVSLQRFRDGMFDRDTMGADPHGRLIYDASGVMSAFLASRAWLAGEVTQDWSSFLAYSGRWSLAASGEVTHLLDTASIAAMVGTPLVRHVEWGADGTLVLTTAPHTDRAGRSTHDRLIWRRER